MHGFNQGYSVIENLIENDLPDVFLVQEHWLAPCVRELVCLYLRCSY